MLQTSSELWHHAVIEHIPGLRRYIRGWIGDPHDAEDVLQQTLINALQSLVDFSAPFNLGAWLTTIARNECSTFLRQHGRTQAVDPMEFAEQLPAFSSSMGTNTESLLAALERLPAEQRNLLYMKYFTHHRIAEISHLICLPEGTVKRRLHEAKALLKKEMNMPNESCSPPAILVAPVSSDKPFSLHCTGYGLMFGSPGKGLGDVEQVIVYEYPGRVFCYGAQCRVNRKVNLFGQELWEVVNSYHQRAGEKERFLYYTLSEDEISMSLRIFHFEDPDQVQVDIEPEDLVSPKKLFIHSDTRIETDSEIICCDTVEVTIGESHYPACIRERSLSDDFHGSTYSESFFNQDGREILCREYIGENWKMGGFVTWEKWQDAPEVEFAGRKFRLWMEFILIGVTRELPNNSLVSV